MPSPWKPEHQRSRPPDTIRAFEVRCWVVGCWSIPPKCACTWVPMWRPEFYVPAGRDPDVAGVIRYQCAGLRLKFTNATCPAIRQHR